MPLQNFVDHSPPFINAAWLNQVDVFVNTLFAAATTQAQARTAIGAAASGANTDITSIAGSAAKLGGGVANNIPYQSGVGATSFLAAPTTANTAVTWDGSAIVWGAVVTPTAAQTLTNKRTTARVGSTTSSATPTINTDDVDIYKLTAQAVDITSFTTNLTGTPTDGQCLIIEITGTAARTIAWGASFEASTVALPTTTVTTAMLAVAFLYNAVTSKWRCVGAV